jgi:TolA-binding protein
MKPEQPGDSGLEPTAQRVAEFVVRELHAEERSDPGALALRLAKVRRIQRQRRWVLAAAAVTLALVFGIAGLRARGGKSPARLSYRVNDQAPLAGGYVFAPRAADSLLSFSDGSKVRMAARARGRVVEVTSDGARFALEEGNATVDIRPHPRSRWLFEAGPFLVRVHGTSFTLDWHPAETVFEVRLRSGAVSVANPVSGSEIQLRSGQTLRVSLREQTTTLGVLSDADDSAPAPSSNPVPTAAASSGPALRATLPEQPAESARWSHRGWPAALKEGKASAVVSEAGRLGVAQVLARADGEDLWALANAARYAGQFALAEQALTTQRARFPASSRARESAFLLGRLHDGDAGGLGNALTWYERYLTEAPAGAHASDALGRKMTLLQRWDRRTEASVVAHEYLRRFPAGTYANAARTLIRAEAKGQ